VRTSQPVSPPGRPTNAAASTETGLGGVSTVFDSSSALVASRTEDNPSTVWIWDTSVGELRAVLIFHSSVTLTRWHPSIHELLLVTCQDEKETVIFAWDPLSAGPNLVDYQRHLSCRRRGGNSEKINASWVNLAPAGALLLLVGDGCSLLVSMSDSDAPQPPWQDANLTIGASSHTSIEDSILEIASIDDDASEMDDTFSFKRTPR
jgi:WD repeat-containing protein WRAP73